MRAACPSCGAVYDIPEQRLAPAVRRLRCARCAYEWTIGARPSASPVPPPPEPPAPPVPLPVPPAPPAAEPLAARPSPFPPYEEPREFAWGALAAWLVSLAVLVGLVFAAVWFRAEIMQAWPPSQRLFGLFGAGPH